jgi:transposase
VRVYAKSRKRYGVIAQQLTTWRRSAHKGELALVADEALDFVTLGVSEPVAPRKPAPIVISIGRVSVRLDADAPSTRIGAIATALDRNA